MDFLKFAAERYSVRSFENKHLEKEVIDKILACGHIAPTVCNNQPQSILVLNTDAAIEALKGAGINDCTIVSIDGEHLTLLRPGAITPEMLAPFSA